MSTKINDLINDKETPISVKELLQEFVEDFEKQNSEVWLKEVTNQSSEYHRKTLLMQGRCDFDTPINGLSPQELICLYNYYYFPMHFQSSYLLIHQLWNIGLAKNFIYGTNTIFIDYGCGTLASSIAFSQVFQQYSKKDKFRISPISRYETDPISVSYIFVDISQNIMKMVSKLTSTIKYSDSEDSEDYSSLIKPCLWNYCIEKLYSNFKELTDDFLYVTEGDFLLRVNNVIFNELKRKIIYKKKWKKLENSKTQINIEPILYEDYSIIINFSYFFSSNSLNIDNLISLINTLSLNKFFGDICIINQNPDVDALNTNWENFKAQLLLRSIIKGVRPIKHFSSSSVRYEVLYKSKFEDIFTVIS